MSADVNQRERMMVEKGNKEEKKYTGRLIR
jgi:hypothetical protein